jgi:adenine/guanine phosphoribosyltransferase-like PRPP-binding protein
MVRKLGHYNFGTRPEPHCSRYYFDTRHAAREIAELAVRWLKEKVLAELGESDERRNLTLLSFEKNRTPLNDAVLGASLAIGCDWTSLDPASVDDCAGISFPGPVVLFFNVIHTGRTYRAVINALRQHRVRVLQHAFAVMLTDPDLNLDGTHPTLEILFTGNRGKVACKHCEQCRIGLDHTDPVRDQKLTLRSYDAWSMLLECKWAIEKFGPGQDNGIFACLPDMGDVFEKHGNWIALKILARVQTLEARSDIVFVCPDESHIERLITKVGVLMENQQVTVRIPRTVLDEVDDRKYLTEQRNEEWHRQLRHLGDRKARVVLIDEFRMHGTTERAMLSLLQQFEVEPLAYIPILDFSGHQDPEGLSVYPLYSIPATRNDQ